HFKLVALKECGRTSFLRSKGERLGRSRKKLPSSMTIPVKAHSLHLLSLTQLTRIPASVEGNQPRPIPQYPLRRTRSLNQSPSFLMRELKRRSFSTSPNIHPLR